MIIANESLVSVLGDKIIVMRPRGLLTRDQALNLAAWLVAVADRDDEFPAVLKQVLNT